MHNRMVTSSLSSGPLLQSNRLRLLRRPLVFRKRLCALYENRLRAFSGQFLIDKLHFNRLQNILSQSFRIYLDR